jgi:RHS repeat-associated protein
LACGAPGSNFSLTNQYLVGLGGEQVTELDGSDDWLHTNVWAGGRLLATYDGFGIHFPLTDPLGTKRIQANAYGAVDETCFSLPYGDGLNCIGDDATEHHFTGKERDTESGNDYFEARYYSSAMGRFMSPDWSAKAEPVPYAKLDDPQTLNLYGYVRNNPLTHADADGHCYPLCTMAIGAAVGFVAGAGAEYIGEKLKGEKVDSSKIWHAGAGGALAGAITGLAGPEAGLAVKLGTSVGGQVIGGAVERKLNGEKVLDLKAGAKDAAAGLLGTKIDGAAEKTFASTFLKKAVPAATEAVIDAGQRGSGSEAKPAPPRPQPQPQTQHN